MKKVLIAGLVLALCLGLAGVSVFSKTQRNQTKNVKPSQTAWLGVMTQTVDEDIADAFEVDVDYGAIINEVVDDSPAELAKLDDGDVIISFNGQKVWDSEDLTDFVEDAEVGSKATVGIMRDGKEMSVEVELGSRPRGSSWAFRNDDTPGAFWFNGPGEVQTYNWSGHGYIGVQLTELTKQLAEYFGLPDGEGVLITEVDKDSPAEKAGLRAGDIITDIGDEEVSDYGDVKEIVSESEKGDKLTLTVVRNKTEQKVEVEVAEIDGGEYGYQFLQPTPLPDMPDIDVRVPRVTGKSRLNSFAPGAYFDYDSHKKDMEAFKADMERYKMEMKALNKDMKGFNKDDRLKLEREIEELRAKIQELEKKIQ